MKKPDLTLWHLQFQGSAFGPLTIDEVKVILKGGNVSKPLFAMGPGVDRWTLVDKVPELLELSKLIKVVKQAEDNSKRKSRRVPMLAMVRFFMNNQIGEASMNRLGVCRDLSVGGMMILSQAIPGASGMEVTLTVMPEGLPSVQPFEVKATLRHILPDKNGFAVEFLNLSAKSRQQIENYVQSVSQNQKNPF